METIPTTQPTLEQLEAQINSMQPSGTNEVQPPIEAQIGKPIPAPVPAGEIVKEAQTVEPLSDGQVPQVETKDRSAWDEVASKKHIQDREQLAKMYLDLEKGFHKKRQEASQPKPEEVISQPQVQPNDPNAQFVEELSRNPILAVAKLADFIAEQKLKPFYESKKENDLRSELSRLQNSEDTRNTFNIPEVQDEMKKVIEADPRYLDNLPANLETLHDIALGRLARRGFSVTGTQNNSGLQALQPVEGRSKSVAPQLIDSKKMPLNELEAYIIAQQG